MYKAGDKIRIKTWRELEEEFEITSYPLIDSIAANLPDGFAFSKGQDEKVSERCKNRTDIIEKVDKERGWYYLKNSKTIVTKYVIKGTKSSIKNVTDKINDRFEILDL